MPRSYRAPRAKSSSLARLMRRNLWSLSRRGAMLSLAGRVSRRQGGGMASVPVIELSGVGPAIAARLNELGLFTSEDLLRSERRRLAELVEGASVAQIRRWQAVSALLEVNGMTVTLAEALHARGIEAL